MHKIIIILLLLSLQLLSAQELDFGGYVKDMVSYSDGAYSGMPKSLGQWQNTFQGRVNLNAYAGDFTLSLQSRHLLVYQKNQKEARTYLAQFENDKDFVDLEWDYFSRQDILASGEIDRLYLDWTQGNMQITVGRQRIAWGSAMVWNITDFFNPFNILDFDYEEKPGSDAIRFQYYTGPTSQVDLAFSPSEDGKNDLLAGRLVFNFFEYDFNLLAALQNEIKRYALNWSGDLSGAGFRGELVYTDPDISFLAPWHMQPGENIFPRINVDTPYWSYVLSFDYTFSNSFYIHTEYMYNELGTTKNSAVRFLDILETGELSPARHSVYQEFAYDLTPLLRASYFVLLNPSDKSHISVPSLQYSVTDNTELYCLAFIGSGESNSEFGGYPAQYFLRLKYSF